MFLEEATSFEPRASRQNRGACAWCCHGERGESRPGRAVAVAVSPARGNCSLATGFEPVEPGACQHVSFFFYPLSPSGAIECRSIAPLGLQTDERRGCGAPPSPGSKPGATEQSCLRHEQKKHQPCTSATNVEGPQAAPSCRPPHSHSIVLGGFEDTSYTTRLTPLTSLMMRLAIRAMAGWGRRAQSAVMPSRLVTARRAMTLA